MIVLQPISEKIIQNSLIFEKPFLPFSQHSFKGPLFFFHSSFVSLFQHYKSNSKLSIKGQMYSIMIHSQLLILLGMEKSSEKTRGKLTINIPQSQKKIEENPLEDEQIYVKPIYSVKHARKPNVRFNFDQDKIETVREKKSKKLERQNGMLLKSLDVLKVGAISAIAEKQEQIDNMRSQFVCEQVRQLQQEIEDLLRQRRELREEIQQLQQKLKFQRESYMRLLEQKDRVIEQLYVELGSTQIQIEKLQKFQEMKEKKIKIIQQQNNYLFHQLQEEKIAHLKEVYQHVEQMNIQISSSSLKMLETIPEVDPPSNEGRSLQDGHQNLQLVEFRHRQQLNQLTLFYEKRLAEMRQIYERQLQVWPIEHSKQNSLKNELMEDVTSLKQTVAPIAHKLSNELNVNMKLLSDCYSMTKRDAISKCDKSSIQGSETEPIDFNFRFMKRVANTPASHTTSSLKVEDGLRFMVAEAKKRHETEISEEQAAQKQVKSGQKTSLAMRSFMLGALTGGTAAFIIGVIFRR